MPVNKELLKGSMKTLVLKMLLSKSSHGYELAQRIEQLTKGNIILTEGTLYPLLHSLEADKCIESFWEKPAGKRKRKVYKLTKLGKENLSEKTKSWNEFVKTMKLVLEAA